MSDQQPRKRRWAPYAVLVFAILALAVLVPASGSGGGGGIRPHRAACFLLPAASNNDVPATLITEAPLEVPFLMWHDAVQPVHNRYGFPITITLHRPDGTTTEIATLDDADDMDSIDLTRGDVRCVGTWDRREPLTFTEADLSVGAHTLVATGGVEGFPEEIATTNFYYDPNQTAGTAVVFEPETITITRGTKDGVCFRVYSDRDEFFLYDVTISSGSPFVVGVDEIEFVEPEDGPLRRRTSSRHECNVGIAVVWDADFGEHFVNLALDPVDQSIPDGTAQLIVIAPERQIIRPDPEPEPEPEPEPQPQPQPEPEARPTGTWNISVNPEAVGSCSDSKAYPETIDVVLKERTPQGLRAEVSGIGNSLEDPWTGFYDTDARELTFTGKKSEPPGQTEATFTLTYDPEADTLNGDEEWDYRGPSETCLGGHSAVESTGRG